MGSYMNQHEPAFGKRAAESRSADAQGLGLGLGQSDVCSIGLQTGADFCASPAYTIRTLHRVGLMVLHPTPRTLNPKPYNR